MEFRRFKKQEQCEATWEAFKDQTHLFCELVDWTHERKIQGIFAFDSYFTNTGILNHIHSKQDSTGFPRGYVGELKFNRKLDFNGHSIKANELAALIPPEDRQELRRGNERQWFFTCTLHIPNINHNIRIVILWQNRRDDEPCKILVTNRIQWEVRRTLGVYRKRWAGTETFHRNGKQELGMGGCQLSDGQGHTRKMYLVMLAYTLLMRELRHLRAHDWAIQKLKTIGEARRAMVNESLRATLKWVWLQPCLPHSSQKNLFIQLDLV